MAAVFLEELLHGMWRNGKRRAIGEVVAVAGLNVALVQFLAPEHAKPMRTWISLATSDEIAQDAEQLPLEQLAALVRLQSASTPAPSADSPLKKRGGAPRKKKPSGD